MLARVQRYLAYMACYIQSPLGLAQLLLVKKTNAATVAVAIAMAFKRPEPSSDPRVYDHSKFVSELVWLPSYLGLTFLMIGVTGSTGLVILVALLACRVALELLYRIMFGARRRELGIGAIAFVAQCVIWGGVWAWYVFR